MNKTTISILTGILFVAEIIGASRWHSKVCTKDAKVCSDGAVVQRVRPFCNFKDCPKSYNDPGIPYYFIAIHNKPHTMCRMEEALLKKLVLT